MLKNMIYSRHSYRSVIRVGYFVVNNTNNKFSSVILPRLSTTIDTLHISLNVFWEFIIQLLLLITELSKLSQVSTPPICTLDLFMNIHN